MFFRVVFSESEAKLILGLTTNLTEDYAFDNCLWGLLNLLGLVNVFVMVGA